MAITGPVFAGSATGATNSVNISPPAGLTASSLRLIFVMSKPWDSTPTTTWAATDVSLGASVANGTVANTVNNGSVRASVFEGYGSDSTNANVAATSGSPILGWQCRLEKDAGESWDVTHASGFDGDQSGTTVSVTASSDPGFTAGDVVLIGVALRDDSIFLNSPSISIPGVTLGTATWEAKKSTTSGNDGAMYVGYATVTSGTSSGALTYTSTSTVSGAAECSITVTRVRAVSTSSTLAVAEEAEVALGFGVGAAIAVSSESEVALPFGVGTGVAVGVAVESEVAVPFARAAGVAPAVESEVAVPFARAAGVSRALENETALPFTLYSGTPLVAATEAETALPFALAKAAAAALESEVALPFTVVAPIAIDVELALESEMALPFIVQTQVVMQGRPTSRRTHFM